FFFQAEDGIRDGHVTGVQTCALPIFLVRTFGIVARMRSAHANDPKVRTRITRMRTMLSGMMKASRAMARRWFSNSPPQVMKAFRSEERRVGKECRCRWACWG